jgi:hypothetical protein
MTETRLKQHSNRSDRNNPRLPLTTEPFFREQTIECYLIKGTRNKLDSIPNPCHTCSSTKRTGEQENKMENSYDNFMQANEKQMYHWVKTGVATFTDFETWMEAKTDAAREYALDQAYWSSQG